MKTLTTYGECPNCDNMCQPDFAAHPDENGDVIEYAACCDCEIIWEYERNMNDNLESHWKVFEPINIMTFQKWGGVPYECE